MKKFLSILAAVGLTATTSTAVVACTQSVDAKDTMTAVVKQKEASKIGLLKKDKDGENYVLGATTGKVTNKVKDVKGKEVAADAFTIAFSMADPKTGDVTVSVAIDSTKVKENIQSKLNLEFSYKDGDKDKTGKLDMKKFKYTATSTPVEKVAIDIDADAAKKVIVKGKTLDLAPLVKNADKLQGIKYEILTANKVDGLTIEAGKSVLNATAETAGTTVKVTISATNGTAAVDVDITINAA